MRIILGIDGGGTKTVCLAASPAGAVLGRGDGGPANYLSEGIERAEESLRAAIRGALQAAEASPQDVALAAAGLAGASRESDRRVLGEVFDRLLPGVPRIIEPDAVIALLGATDCRPGVIIISGTGSMAFGMDHNERRARTGGWGFILGDEGSGYDIARRGLIACLRAYDGRGPETAIRAKVLAVLGLENTEDLIPFSYANPLSPGRIAALYPAVLEAADEGDPIACRLIEEAAAALAEMVATTAAKLDFGQEGPLFTMAGGVFRGRSLRERFRQALVRRCPSAVLEDPRHPPEVGALYLARARLEGVPLFAARC